MAEHLRNQLAREGFVLRADSIQTLTKFVGSLAGDLQEVSPAIFHLLVRNALAASDAPEFRGVHDYPGFQRAITNLVDELHSAGCTSDCLEGGILDVFSRVLEDLRLRSLCTRAQHLRAAAARVENGGIERFERLLFDGFYRFAAAELDLIGALRRRVDIVVTLPDWEGAEFSKRTLAKFGFREKRLGRVRPAPRDGLVTASNLEQEVEEIARRILREAESGRPFQEMGVVVRGYAPYVPALRSTFERFGIPARYYFPQPLADHPAVARIVRLVDAYLSGWDHETALGALRMLPASEANDRFEFSVLEEIPAQGLESLLAIGECVPRFDEGTPAAKLKTLCSAFPMPAVTDGVGHEQAFLWRSHAAALEAFVEVVEETEKALSSGHETEGRLQPSTEGSQSFGEFWADVKALLKTSSFWPRDRRRNVVPVMDAFEARQWELPVVFVCGLVEKQFPRHHFENPLFGDDARLQLRSRDIRLRTSADENAEEQFLFELATTRATESLVLTWPKYNAQGDENLRSFLLEAFIESRVPANEAAISVRTAPARPRRSGSSPTIRSPELLEWLRSRHATLSPSSIQRFLECPFAFFAGRSLKLRGWPARPAERLDPLLQGAIVHDVLAGCRGVPLMLDQIFEEIFAERCRKARVPQGHHTEAVRLEMLRSLREFQQQALSHNPLEILTEQEFKMPLPGGLSVRGRIDRMDVFGGRKALVIDYKYAASHRMRDYISATEDDESVQAGLYLLAARQVFRVKPVGMLYCTLRKDVRWGGWHVNWPGCNALGTSCTEQFLGEIADKAAALSLEVSQAIVQGRIEPAPADSSICERCDFRDICRVETAALVTVAGRGQQ